MHTQVCTACLSKDSLATRRLRRGNPGHGCSLYVRSIASRNIKAFAYTRGLFADRVETSHLRLALPESL